MYGEAIDKKYKNSSYGFPSDEVSNDIKKGKGWNLQYQKAILSSYILGNTSISAADREKMDKLRMYSDGRQAVTPYLNWLRPQVQDTQEVTDSNGNKSVQSVVIQRYGSTEGEWNLSTDIFSPAPKLKDIVISTYDDIDYDIIADAVDKMSMNDKKSKKAELLKEKFFGKDIAARKAMMGIPHKSPDFIPENDMEMQLHELAGGFQLSREVAITTALEDIFYKSDLEGIKRKVIGDFWDINQAAIIDYTDPQTGHPGCEYVDPKSLIMLYSQEYDSKLSPFYARQRWWTIVDLRKVTGWSETTLKSIANKFCGNNYGNPNSIVDTATNYDGTQLTNWNGVMAPGIIPFYNGFLIPVQEAEYRTWNNDTPEKGKDKDYEMIYTSKWIPGTDYIFHFGIQYDMKRPQQYATEFSLHYVKKRGQSPVERIVPFLDQVMLSWLQYQNNVCKESPAGLAIEIQSLQNVNIGGKTINPVALMLNRVKNGHLFYKVTNSSGLGNVGAAKPIQDLPTTYGTSIEAWAKTFNTLMFSIQTEIGMTPQADASPDAASGDAAVRTAQMALNATSKALKPLFINYIKLKDMTAKGCIARLQTVMETNPKVFEDMVNIIGNANASEFKVGKADILATYGIKLRARADDEMKKQIYEQLQLAQQAGKNGQNEGITTADALHIMDILTDTGNIHECVQYLLVAQKRFKKMLMEDAAQNQQMNSQGAQALEAQKQQGAKESVIFETNEKIRLDGELTKNKIKVDFWNNYSNWKFNKEASEQDFNEAQQTTALQSILNMVEGRHKSGLDMMASVHQSGLDKENAAHQGEIDKSVAAAAPQPATITA